MNTHYSDESLYNYMTDTLPEREKEEITTHLPTCADCQHRIDTLQTKAVRWRKQYQAELNQIHASEQATFEQISGSMRRRHNRVASKVTHMLSPLVAITVIAFTIFLFLQTDQMQQSHFTPEPSVIDNSAALQQALNRLTYTPFALDSTVTLKNGKADNIELIAAEFADLNGDGITDAAFLIAHNIADTTYYEVGAALNSGNNRLIHVGNELLYPFIQPPKISIVGLQIVVTSSSPKETYIIADGRLQGARHAALNVQTEAANQQALQTGWEGNGPTPAGSLLTLETLANMVYQTEFARDGSAELNNGIFSETPRTTILLRPQHAYGDLNDDNIPEAVVLLVSETGGSGSFYELAVVREIDGQPQQWAITPLGDRTAVESITIEQKTITVHFSADRNGPSRQSTYELQNDTLQLNPDR